MALQNISVKLPAVITGTDHFTFHFYCSKELCRFPCYYYDRVVCGTELFISFLQCWMITLQILNLLVHPWVTCLLRGCCGKKCTNKSYTDRLIRWTYSVWYIFISCEEICRQINPGNTKVEGKRTHVNILTATMILIIPHHYLNMKRSFLV